MAPVTLVSDSASDIPYATLSELGVQAVPLSVHIGKMTYLDSDLTIDRFWALASDTDAALATSQPSVGAFARVFQHLVDQGHEVLCIVISSRISGTFNSAWLAAREFGDRVTVFDSGFWSVAQGYQIRQAAAAIAQGKAIAQVVSLLEDLRSRTDAYLSMDTVAYAKRGGRFEAVLSPLRRFIDGFNIKPIVRVVAGQPEFVGVARSMSGVMQRIRKELRKFGNPEHLMVAHTRVPERASQFACELASDFGYPSEQVTIAELGPVLASHGGPGAIAAAMVRKP
jgi:DegV family protein with EDD domain